MTAYLVRGSGAQMASRDLTNLERAVKLISVAVGAERQCAPSAPSCASVRPLNFTVRRRVIEHFGTGTAGILVPLIFHL